MVNWHRDELVHEHTPGVGCLHQSKQETHQKLVPGQIIIKLSSNYYQIIIKLASNYHGKLACQRGDPPRVGTWTNCYQSAMNDEW